MVVSFPSLVWGWRTVRFQLFCLYCNSISCLGSRPFRLQRSKPKHYGPNLERSPWSSRGPGIPGIVREGPHSQKCRFASRHESRPRQETQEVQRQISLEIDVVPFYAVATWTPKVCNMTVQSLQQERDMQVCLMLLGSRYALDSPDSPWLLVRNHFLPVGCISPRAEVTAIQEQ